VTLPVYFCVVGWLCCARAAGSIMYEYALRLARDCPGIKGVQGQAKCLLAAINALRLVEPKFAWVTRPLTPAADDDDDNSGYDADNYDDVGFSASPPKRPRALDVTDSVRHPVIQF